MRVTGTPRWVAVVLADSATWWCARIALTLPYWWSGVDKLLNSGNAVAEIRALGVPDANAAFVLLLIVQLGGSALVIANAWAWLGAGALAVFTALVTLLAHPFWNLQGDARFAAMNTFLEHIALIAAFVYAAMAAAFHSSIPASSHSKEHPS